MKTCSEIMFKLIQLEIKGNPFDQGLCEEMDEASWGRVYSLSKVHDLAHLVGDFALNQNLIPFPAVQNQFLTQSMLAVRRYRALEYDLREIKRVLNEAEIPFLPLKGAVLRHYYPQPWMRTSCDIDILVHEKDLEVVKNALEEKLKYRFDPKDSHEMSGFSTYGIHLEIHYRLIEKDLVTRAEKPLENVWDYAHPVEGTSCYELTDAMFYYYHVAHMAKHFEHGGCGIRPIIDLYVLRRVNRCGDDAERDRLLEEGGISKFAHTAEKLAEIWFENGEYDDLTKMMETYLLTGGVYGSNENRISVQQVNKGSKFKYALSKIWIPYEVIRFHYPSLEKHRWMLPFYEIRRWFKLIFCGELKRSLQDLKMNASTTENQTNSARQMLRDLELL